MSKKPPTPKKSPSTKASKSQPQLALQEMDAEAAMKLRLAKSMVNPSVNAAVVIESFQANLGGKDVVLENVLPALYADIEQLEAGDDSRLEAMLYSQAVALQTIFASLARRASNQDYLKQYETYLSLALRAQAQSRATVQAIVELKYPRQVAFVKQANIAHGPQQVNNAPHAEPTPRAEQLTNSVQNKLLETDNGKLGQRLDGGTAKAAKRGDCSLETVGQVNGSKKR